MKGKGVPHLNEHGKGDLIVSVRVQTPTKLTKEQKALLRQLGETLQMESAPHAHGIMDRVKDIFS